MESFNLMRWNVRGLNKRNKQMPILDICGLNKVCIGALLETKIKGEKLKEVMGTSFTGWDYYSSSRLEGRILLIWKACWVKIEAIKDHDQFSHCRVRLCTTDQDFCLTVVYGSNQLEARRSLWTELANLTFPIKPWLIVGDFNAVFDSKDRMGARAITMKELEDARHWIDLGMVEEMKIMGSFYTWSNNQEGGNHIFSKLDRVFFNEDWLDSFPNVSAVANWEVVSDHCVILLKQLSVQKRVFNRFISTICGLAILNSSQQSWLTGDVFRKYEESKRAYQQAKSTLFSDPKNHSLCLVERSSFLEFKKQEKIYAGFLYQKSKIDWLRFGDESSSMFYASMKKRKINNRIVSSVTEGGRVEDNYPKVINHFVQHFQSFLGCSSKTSGHIDSSIIDLGPIMNFEDQLELIKPFSYQDVKTAMFSINAIKSPGPDGFGAGFFKSLWTDIGKEVSKAVLEFFDTGYIPKSLNSTILALIPKVDHPTNATKYRPIACCATMYKCISKMHYHRLIYVLPKLINQNQGAFIKNISLAHNVLILQDLIKGHNRRQSSPRCLMKIDISKAYDSIDWDFFREHAESIQISWPFH
ncbi:uncharacterized protein LOC133825395 [Humulus lupulus]|uniref:uncharacterized protein LOC133825395 n=1 Tax=Humulus lupulus TaxID=3486 RepID=UPI002B40C16A|nr:uncharacterized protein LOC133825395 [Humulus lupulus]